MRIGLLVVLLGVGLAFNGLAWAGEKGGGKGKGKGKGKGNGELVEKGKGKGKGKEKGRPHGWDQGKKKGWHDQYPPGWDKKSDKDKAKWKQDVEAGKDIVGTEADKKGVSKEEKSRLREAFERICRGGRDIKESTGVVVEEIKKGKKAIQIMKENGIVIEIPE